MNIHTGIGEPRRRLLAATPRRRSPASGSSSGWCPGNVDRRTRSSRDDPGRLRAMIVESSNPAHSLADSPRMRAALERARPAGRPRRRDDRDRSARRLRAPVAVAVREVGGELLLPRVPAQRLPAAAPRARPAPGRTCCPSRRSIRRLVRAAGALEGIDLDGLSAATPSAAEPSFAAMLFGLVGRAAGAAPPAPRDRLRDARPDAAGRSCRRVGAVAQRPWSRADDARLGSARRLRGRGTRARRGAVRARSCRGNRASCSRVDDYAETCAPAREPRQAA